MPGTAATPDGLATRRARVLFSPWFRLALLVALLVGAAGAALIWEPQQFLDRVRQPRTSGASAAVFFAFAYALCTTAFLPRPFLNLAAGALLGSQVGSAAALAGTVLGAGIAFGLGRLLGQGALRPLLRARWLSAADRQLSRHGFRSTLALRLFPGIPFAAANYCAAISRMGWLPFLLATGLGSVPNTVAYVIAGARASTPASPAFLVSAAFIVVSTLGGAVIAWHRNRHRNGNGAATGTPGPGMPGSGAGAPESDRHGSRDSRSAVSNATASVS